MVARGIPFLFLLLCTLLLIMGLSSAGVLGASIGAPSSVELSALLVRTQESVNCFALFGLECFIPFRGVYSGLQPSSTPLLDVLSISLSLVIPSTKAFIQLCASMPSVLLVLYPCILFWCAQRLFDQASAFWGCACALLFCFSSLDGAQFFVSLDSVVQFGDIAALSAVLLLLCVLPEILSATDESEVFGLSSVFLLLVFVLLIGLSFAAAVSFLFLLLASGSRWKGVALFGFCLGLMIGLLVVLADGYWWIPLHTEYSFPGERHFPSSITPPGFSDPLMLFIPLLSKGIQNLFVDTVSFREVMRLLFEVLLLLVCVSQFLVRERAVRQISFALLLLLVFVVGGGLIDFFPFMPAFGALPLFSSMAFILLGNGISRCLQSGGLFFRSLVYFTVLFCLVDNIDLFFDRSEIGSKMVADIERGGEFAALKAIEKALERPAHSNWIVAVENDFQMAESFGSPFAVADYLSFRTEASFHPLARSFPTVFDRLVSASLLSGSSWEYKRGHQEYRSDTLHQDWQVMNLGVREMILRLRRLGVSHVLSSSGAYNWNLSNKASDIVRPVAYHRPFVLSSIKDPLPRREVRELPACLFVDRGGEGFFEFSGYLRVSGAEKLEGIVYHPKLSTNKIEQFSCFILSFAESLHPKVLELSRFYRTGKTVVILGAKDFRAPDFMQLYHFPSFPPLGLPNLIRSPEWQREQFAVKLNRIMQGVPTSRTLYERIPFMPSGERMMNILGHQITLQ